jgi:hypothetical protein
MAQKGCGIVFSTEPPSDEEMEEDELIRGTTELVQHFRLLGGVHIGARALLDINLIWFDMARLSQWGGGGCFLLVQMISTCLICA